MTTELAVGGGRITKHAAMATMLDTPAWDGASLYLLHWSRSRAERAAWMLLELGGLYPEGAPGRTLPAFEIMQCPDGPEFRVGPGPLGGAVKHRVFQSKLDLYGALYGRAWRFTAQNGGFRPGQ
jgi:hypothetical protein